MFKQLLFYLLIFFSCTFVAAQEKEIIYKSYLYNDMGAWKQAIDDMHAETVKSNERDMELLNYEYGYIGWCIGNKRKNEAEFYLDRSLTRLERLRSENHKIPIINAYESAFIGFQIGLAKLKAPKLGPRSLDFAKKSVADDENNAFGLIQMGNIYYFMPPLFGGSKEKAINYYLRAEQLMAAKGRGNWNYLALLVQLAGSFEEIGKIDKSDSIYRKVLSIEPHFSWVKDELYPDFTKKHNIK